MLCTGDADVVPVTGICADTPGQGLLGSILPVLDPLGTVLYPLDLALHLSVVTGVVILPAFVFWVLSDRFLLPLISFSVLSPSLTV